MSTWIVAALAGIALALILYGLRERRDLAVVAPLVVLRAIALTFVLALLLDAPAGPRRAPPPLVALDVSASWLRGSDSAAWRAARLRARQIASDSILLFGDSVRRGELPALPADAATRVRPLVERALGAGRPLVVLTDGEIDDPAVLPSFPTGSRVEATNHADRVDMSVLTLEAPRAAVSGDTIEVRITVRNGNLPSPAGTLTLLAAGRTLASTRLEELPARTERTEGLRIALDVAPAPLTLSAVATVGGDIERRNDTLSVAVEVARAAGAVLASTSPDFDVRFLVPVLRGAVSLPTRAYFRVAPGVWRLEGALSAVAESEVRNAIREAPLAILHGDTALFGAPRGVAPGSLALIAPPADGDGEWYAVAAPPSPIAAALSGISWDSLAPLEAAARLPAGDWVGLMTARGRQFDRRPVVTGSEASRRVAVIGGAGFWRWQFRGGSSADAYAALWGSIFDWLTAERSDLRGAIPADALLRAGDPIHWRRGRGDDSVVVALVRKRDAGAREDSLLLRFGSGGTVAETAPLSAGVYDVRVPGGTALLVVNASRELLPRARAVTTSRVGEEPARGDQPRLRDAGWSFLLVILALCAEWLLRRRMGLR